VAWPASPDISGWWITMREFGSETQILPYVSQGAEHPRPIKPLTLTVLAEVRHRICTSDLASRTHTLAALEEEAFQQLQRNQQHHRREIQPSHRWEPVANRHEDGLREAVHDRRQLIAPIQAHPGQDDGHQDDERVEIDEPGKQKHGS